MDAVTAFTIDKRQKNTQLLIQPQYSPMPVEEQISILYCGTQGLLKEVPLDKVHEFEARFLQELRTSHQRDVLDVLKTGVINDEIRGILSYGFIERNKSPDRLYTEYAEDHRRHENGIVGQVSSCPDANRAHTYIC